MCKTVWKCGKTSVKMCVILCERMCKTCENVWDSVKKCKTSVKMCVRLCENICKTSLNEQCEKLVKTSVWRFVLFRSNKNNKNKNNNNNNNFATYRIAAQACDQKQYFFFFGLWWLTSLFHLLLSCGLQNTGCLKGSV